MGRHTAADGSSVHPLVAEGPARRANGPTPQHGVEELPQRSSEIGWPAPPKKGEGLGWPGDITSEGEEPADEPAARSRRGWRRWFGVTPAA